MHQQHNLSRTDQYLSSLHLPKLSQLHELHFAHLNWTFAICSHYNSYQVSFIFFPSTRQSGQLLPKHAAHGFRETQTRAGQLDKMGKKQTLRRSAKFDCLKARGFEVSFRICSGTDNYFQFQQWWTSGSLNSSERWDCFKLRLFKKLVSKNTLHLI